MHLGCHRTDKNRTWLDTNLRNVDFQTNTQRELNMERSLVLLKPDCVQRRLMGEIITRFENKGLNIIGMKMLQVTPDMAKQHYAEHVEKPFYPGLEAFITGGPIVLPICAPVRCIDKAKPFLSGYLAAKVPKAGACQKLVPNPIRITERIITA